jgi:putative transcriptional regulator
MTGEELGEKLLQAVREMKANIRARETVVHVSEALEARTRSGLSQAQFAALMGVSKRTLQDWEQGRREPAGAAKALLRIAARRPDVVSECLSP